MFGASEPTWLLPGKTFFLKLVGSFYVWTERTLLKFEEGKEEGSGKAESKFQKKAQARAGQGKADRNQGQAKASPKDPAEWRLQIFEECEARFAGRLRRTERYVARRADEEQRSNRRKAEAETGGVWDESGRIYSRIFSNGI